MNIFFRVEKGGTAHGVNLAVLGITVLFYRLLWLTSIAVVLALLYLFRVPILRLLENLPRALHTLAHGG